MQEQGMSVVHHFCSESEEGGNRVLAVLRGWIAQLFPDHLHKILEHVTPVFDQSSQGFGTVSELSEIIQTFAISTPQLRFVIDGLDECSPSDCTRIFEILETQLKHNRIMLFSRDHPSIVSRLFHSSPTLQIGQVQTKEDVVKIIDREIAALLGNTAASTDLIKEVSDALKERADGLHLYARLVIDLLRQQTTLAEVKNTVYGSGVGLRNMYSRILGDMECLPQPQLQRVTRIFQYVLCASRPLALAEMQEAISVERDSMALDAATVVFNMDKLLMLCKPLLAVDVKRDSIRMVHMSVKEALLPNLSSQEGNNAAANGLISRQGIGEVQSHEDIAFTCLAYLSFPRASLLNHDAITAEDIHRDYPFLAYAAVFWSYHLARAGSSKELSGLADQVVQFLHSNAKDAWLQGAMVLEADNWGGRLLMLEMDLITFSNNIQCVSGAVQQSLKRGLLNIQVEWVRRTEAKLGRLHEQVLPLLHSLGRIYGWAGRRRDSQTVFRDLLERHEMLSSEPSAPKLAAMHELGTTYAVLSQHDEARRILFQALEGRRSLLGLDHPDTLKSSDILAGVAHSEGNLQMAEQMYSTSLGVKDRVLGKEHPERLITANNLALVYRSMQRWKEAEDLLLEVVSLRKHVFGDQHSATLRAIDQLGLLYIQEKKWNEGIKFCKQAHNGLEQVLGKEHNQTIAAAVNMARAHYHLGEFDTSVTLLEPSLRNLREQVGEEHLGVQDIKFLLAHSYYQVGRLEEAIRLKADVVELQHRKGLGSEKQSEKNRAHLEEWKRDLREQQRMRPRNLRGYLIPYRRVQLCGVWVSIILLLVYMLDFWI